MEFYSGPEKRPCSPVCYKDHISLLWRKHAKEKKIKATLS